MRRLVQGTLKPDAGIFDLGAAIEYEFIREKTELRVAVSGGVEDIGGYQGSKDRNRFYGVFFEAKPWVSEGEALGDVKHSGGERWTVI